MECDRKSMIKAASKAINSQYDNVFEALAEVEQIENGKIKRKSAREFLKEQKR